MARRTPVLSAHGGETTRDSSGLELLSRIGKEQTKGQLSVVELLAAPGEGSGLHVHPEEDELVYLLEGELEVTVADQSLVVGAGACALLPSGLPHGFTNKGDVPARLLSVSLPGREVG